MQSTVSQDGRCKCLSLVCHTQDRAYAEAVAYDRKMAGIREQSIAHGQHIKKQMAVSDLCQFNIVSTIFALCFLICYHVLMVTD
jgi:hypothetical protein